MSSRTYTKQEILEVLTTGEIVSTFPTARGSNYTFWVEIDDGHAGIIKAIYKPEKGEAPLWDFENGTLFKREYAAYLLSQSLGWDFIPDTVIREGPYGIGSVQLYINHKEGSFYSSFRRSHSEQLLVIAVFDIIANNADRKDSHCIKDNDGKIWGIDQGLTFNHDLKLRTAIWDFWGQPIPEEILRTLMSFEKRFPYSLGDLTDDFGKLLNPMEIEALFQRITWIISLGKFPEVT
jgi:hypothetical protein